VGGSRTRQERSNLGAAHCRALWEARATPGAQLQPKRAGERRQAGSDRSALQGNNPAPGEAPSSTHLPGVACQTSLLPKFLSRVSREVRMDAASWEIFIDFKI